ncbi:MAG: hypothetical protein JXB46_06175, partial [Candidatus Eisenbacteria bacterium]|nr:hypothetical protein [Candidatus Eisenbacteria bacterium]
RPADILLLTPDDLIAVSCAGDVRRHRETYLARKRDHEATGRLSPPPFLGQPPGAAVMGPAPSTEMQPSAPRRTLQGQGFSPGRVTGISCKATSLHDPAAMHAPADGRILVCPKAKEWRPDWLSLFTAISGLVTVGGAQLGHATQIARECGIPFVSLPSGDWDAIPDGAPMEVDGEAGTVVILEAKPDKT